MAVDSPRESKYTVFTYPLNILGRYLQISEVW